MRLRVARFPDTPSNPYLDLFDRALSQSCAVDVSGVSSLFSLLNDGVEDVDVLHFHWNIESHWRVRRFEWFWRRASLFREMPLAWRIPQIGATRKRFGSHARLNEFLAGLDQLRQRNIRLVWTMHDAVPPEFASEVDVVGYRELAQRCDLVIVHSHDAKATAIQNYRPRCDVVVMHHGNYEGVYPEPRRRPETLAKYALDSTRPVVVMFGRMRGYKGVDLGIASVKRLRGAVQLLIVGAPVAPMTTESVEALIGNADYVHFIDREVDDQELADVISISDAVLLPYSRITGSGVLLTAWSCGRSVVTTDLPFFREMLAAYPAGGVIAHESTIGGFSDAICECLQQPVAERNRGAKECAQRLDWLEVIKPVASRFKALRHDLLETLR